MKTGMEWQVCNRELAQKLRELGVKQESIFSWVAYPGGTLLHYAKSGKHILGGANQCSAFTVAELGEMLPSSKELILGSWKFDWGAGRFHCGEVLKSQSAFKDFSADTEANARAKCLIYLFENGLIKK